MAAVTEKGNIFTDKNILSENRNKSNNHKPQRNKFTEDIKTKNKFESNSEKTNLYSEAGIITDVITFNESESKTAKISSVIEEKSVLKTENEDTNISLNANNKKSEKLKKLSSREKRKLINESNKAKAKYFHNKTNSQKDVELKLSDNLSQSFKEKSSSSSNQRAYVKDSTEDTSQKEKNYSTKRIDIKENLLSKSNTLLTGVHSASKLANKIDDDNDTDNASNEMISDAVNISEKIFRRYINNFFNNKKSLLKNKVFTDKSDLAQKLNTDSFDEQEKSKKINYMQKARKQQARVAYQTAKNAAQKATNTGVFAKLSEKLAVLLISNPQSGSIILIIILIIGILIALCSSCSIMSMSVGNGVISTTYMTDEKEIYDASVYYTKLEADLRADINKKVQRDKNSFLYDDVRYNIDSFNHDPEVLISFLSAKYPGWSFDLNLKIWFSDIMAGLDYETVKDVEKDIFNAQYELEERTFYEWHYPSANAMFPVLWYVKEYTLVNNGLENIVAELMNEDVQEYYDLLLQYRGNRVWFNSPVNYNWKDTVANLCGYTVDGATSFSTYSNTSNLTYKDDGSTVSTGTTIVLPDGMGKYFTYMGWQTITSPSSLQYQLREQAGMNFDAEGFGIINNRYVVAVTNTYGSVGDYIDVYQSDGTVFPCIIGDIKNQNDAGCNKWGHQQGKVVIEFVVDKSTWYPSHANPGTNACHPEWGGKTITKIVNVGSYSQGEAAPSAGQDGGIVSSSELIDNLSTDVTPHKGIDIAGTYNTNVYAVFDGTVAKVTSHAVSMQSADKEYQVIFDSITNIAVTEGQEISAGDLIGTMTDTESLRNNSGIFVSEKSIGIPHLHIELRNIPDNQQYNPYFYFDVGAEEAPTIIVGNNGTGQLVPGNSETGNLVAQYALSRLGYIYLWGGGHSEAEVRDPNSTRFDCSGLVCWAYCQAGSYIGVHNTKELATMGTPVDYNDMQAGDIILWSSNGSHSGVHHVAIYIGNGMIVEAPYDGQPITTNPVYDKNLIYTIRRLYSN